ncbi:vWA domain-containing protein, partial [Yinghuangia seranimata]|uniref:vWA domain-containing protein n=1 Tax=Yinghuangia seranimata TaxID=408067 RepID=UPI00248CD9E0
RGDGPARAPGAGRRARAVSRAGAPRPRAGGPTRRRVAARAAGRASVAAAAVLALLAAAAPGSAAAYQAADGTSAARSAYETAARRAPSDKNSPIDIAVVVDESGSLSADDVVRERQAAKLVVQGEIADESRALILGFGSADRDGNTAVHEVCPLTVLNGAGREAISACAGRADGPDAIHKRAETEGNGTDIPNAIGEAVSRLRNAGGNERPRLVFLLTDGVTDVSDSPGYGPPGTDRTAAALRRLNDLVLPDAVKAHVQIWPLGFGQADLNALSAIAAGGYQQPCSQRPDSKPHASVVRTAVEATTALEQALAVARCADVVIGDSGTVPTELSVTIPSVATDGTIQVLKPDDARVTYIDPDNKEIPADKLDKGDFEGSHFEVTGKIGSVESLRVRDPKPGTWRVRIAPAPGTNGGGQASVTAIWQGVLQSQVYVNPTAPTAGEDVLVRVALLTRRGVSVRGAKELRAIQVAVKLTGGFQTVSAPAADDGKDPDDEASDGTFTAKLTVPVGASGAYTATADVSAPGIVGDVRTAPGQISADRAVVRAVGVTRYLSGEQGDSVSGQVAVTNGTDQPHRVRAEVVNPRDNQHVRVTAAEFDAQPGNSTHKVTLELDGDARTGDWQFTLKYVDAANGQQIGSAPVTIHIDARPSAFTLWWRDWGTLVIIGVVALFVAVIVVAIATRRRRDARDPRGHDLVLRREGREVERVTIRRSVNGEATFRIDGVRTPRPRVVLSATAPCYRISRLQDGGFAVRTPEGRTENLRRGGAFPVGEDCELLVDKGRSRLFGGRAPGGQGRTTRRQAPGADAPGRGRPVGGPTAAPVDVEAPPTPYDSEW